MLGDISWDAAKRQLTGPAGTSRRLQPQEAAVLSMLIDRSGSVVFRRSIFAHCWGEAPVGDDSLNRVVRRLRQALEEVGSRRAQIDTIPREGYVFTTAAHSDASRRAVLEATVVWRLGLPVTDPTAFDLLKSALARDPLDATCWGWLSLLHCQAAEYCPADECSQQILECTRAASEALIIDPAEPHARIARARLSPLFGNWSAIRKEIAAVLRDAPDNPVARHELAVLEMATGRPSAAIPLIEALRKLDPHAPQYLYKRMYHLWTQGQIGECEGTSLTALQLWPRHPAIWLARFWILIFTDRAQNASRLVTADERPSFPPGFIAFLAEIARISHIGTKASDAMREDHGERCLSQAQLGPANAVAALQALCALGDIDRAFAVARGYYLGEGEAAVQARPAQDGLSVSDQHRRVTQPLFTPSASQMRRDPRFATLCDDIGLGRYWRENAIVPDWAKEPRSN